MTLDDFKFLAIALVDATLEQVDESVKALLGRRIGLFEVSSGKLEFSRVCSGSPPAGGAHFIRAVAFAPDSRPSGTAIITNLRDGWHTMTSGICEDVPGQHMLVRSDDDGEYPITEFEYWEQGLRARLVRSMRDSSRWEFYDDGKVQEFECPENYKKRRIRDRLTRSDICDYVADLGWDLRSQRFWRTSKAAQYFLQQRFRE